MSDNLKIYRIGQILDSALDIPRFNMLDSKLKLAGRMMAPMHYNQDELLLAVAPFNDTPSHSIEGMNIYTSSQIESNNKRRAEKVS